MKGPAFWVQRFAPTKSSRFLGYLIGWTTNAFWWFMAVANCLYMAQLTVGLAQVLNRSYAPQQLHFYLTYVAFALGIFVVNLPRAFKLVPHLLAWGVVLINSTAVFIMISLLVRASPKPSARDVFVQIQNESGWPSNGVVFFLALLPGVITVFGFDSATHITDEVENPTKQVPQVMIGSAILSTIAGFIMTIVYSFSNVNPETLLNPVAQQPLLQLLYDANQSNALTGIGIVGVIVSFFVASIGCLTSWNRLYWSVSCGGGLPFPRTMSKLSSIDKLPLNALVVNIFLIIGLGAIQMGSLTALNAVIGGGVICITLTYAVTFGLAIWRGREFLPSGRWLNLGRLGMPLQFISLLWCIFISIWLCFPLYLPIELATINWASVVFVGVMTCSLLYWIAFQKHIKQASYTE
jgi:amino acid transporter